MIKLMGRKGFTLVEIMIVVAIIALLAAIAIPNLLRARLNANESAAIAGVRTVSTACETFRAAQSPPTYPANMAALTGATPPYLDTTFNNAAGRQGYIYTYTFVTAATYTCTANPVTANVTGVRGFFIDESGVLRAASPAPATVASTPIE